MLRELGNKVKSMEKLGEEDILYEINEAAEQLQQKIDRKSYLLVDSEGWEIGNRPRDSIETHDHMNNKESPKLLYKSMSETFLDLRPNEVQKNVDDTISAELSPSSMAANHNPQANKQTSRPASGSSVILEEESKTYESASSLSLATFTSLMIEFVARLQNLVDAFEELGEVATFKDPLQQQVPESGFWMRF